MGLVREHCQAKDFVNGGKESERLSVVKTWRRVEGRRAQLEELPSTTWYPRRCRGAPCEEGGQPSHRVEEAGGFLLNTSLHISVASAVKKDQALDVSDMTRLEERMLR